MGRDEDTRQLYYWQTRTLTAERRVRAALDEHPRIANPTHGCCAPPRTCGGHHPPECGGDHGMLRPKWPCRTAAALEQEGNDGKS